MMREKEREGSHSQVI